MCKNRRQLSHTLALQFIVRPAPTGGWRPQLRLVNLVPPFLEHLGRSSALQSLVRPLVIVEVQVGAPIPALASTTLSYAFSYTSACFTLLRSRSTNTLPT